MSIKNALIEALDHYKIALDRIDDWFEPSRRASSRNFERWGAIDLIAHSTFFAERRIQVVDDPTGVESLGPFDQALRYVFDRNVDSTWDDVTKSLRASVEGLKKLTLARNDRELASLDGDDQPIWRGIAFYGILHSSGHVAQAMIRAGSKSEAVGLQRKVSETLKEIDSTDRWVGTVDFNYARVLALAGDGAAVAVAREAIARNPELLSRAQQDPDFESIRSELGAGQ